jgi:hypothetical protein
MASKKRGKVAAKNAALKASDFATAAINAGLNVAVGKQAVEGQYRDHIVTTAGNTFTNSVDMDGHFKASEGASPRWDFAVGIKSGTNGESAFWIEPHPANSTGEVNAMLAKLSWLKNKLNTPEFVGLKKLRDAAVAKGADPYRWLATDATIRITAGSREARLLAREGLGMPRRKVVLP